MVDLGGNVVRFRVDAVPLVAVAEIEAVAVLTCGGKVLLLKKRSLACAQHAPFVFEQELALAHILARDEAVASLGRDQLHSDLGRWDTTLARSDQCLRDEPLLLRKRTASRRRPEYAASSRVFHHGQG